jgi:RNA polymerase sigma-70 factor (ECF subfamily)
MVHAGRAFLREWLVSSYDELKRRLARRLGSHDAAAEALHETWLRLGQAGEAAVVQKPQSYLYRMALNVAVDQHRAETRLTKKAEAEALLLSCGDQQLSSDEMIAMRSEVAALERVLSDLPERSRAIFFAAMIDGLQYREIAGKFGMSLRSVEREMSRIFEHCGKRLERSLSKRRFSPRRDVLMDAALDNLPDDTNGD